MKQIEIQCEIYSEARALRSIFSPIRSGLFQSEKNLTLVEPKQALDLSRNSIFPIPYIGKPIYET